ncbi:hypothetical protein LXL04_034681 [Taraxacum kok-saghyz]
MGESETKPQVKLIYDKEYDTNEGFQAVKQEQKLRLVQPISSMCASPYVLQIKKQRDGVMDDKKVSPIVIENGDFEEEADWLLVGRSYGRFHRYRGKPFQIKTLKLVFSKKNIQMRKGANVVDPTFRVTRARAAACKNSEAPKDQGQDRLLCKNPKRSVQDDTNNTTNKRRAVLKDVTNICCDNSYKNCIIPAKIPKKTSKISKKNPIKPDQSIAVDHIVDLDKTVIHQKSIQIVEKESVDQIGKRVGSQLQRFSKKGRNNIPEKTMEANNKVDFKDIDTDEKDPQMCSFYALEIYNNLRASRERCNSKYERGVSEEYKLVADTLYLTVYLIDLFLSQHYIERQKLQLLGITYMLIASKYEEMCARVLRSFVLTQNQRFDFKVVKMEGLVLNELNFHCASPTAKTFLRRFLRAAQASEHVNLVVPSLELDPIFWLILTCDLLPYQKQALHFLAAHLQATL